MLSRHASRRLLQAKIGASRSFATSIRRNAYSDTIQNLKIGKDTKVIYQGFTGRVSTSNAQQSIEYGTNIVGGTTPGKEGEHLGLPLLPSVKACAEQLKPDATAVFVAAHQAAKAMEDAIEAEIPLIVAVAEFIPLHDILRLTQILNTQSKSRIVGANSPGIIAPLGNCRIGFQPLICYLPGHCGVIAKSGTLSYEAVGSLTREGVGQSLCIGMGGDIVAGTNMVDALEVFEKDDETQGIVLIGEIGGRAEQDAAEWIKDYHKRTQDPKPISACVGGMTAKDGRIMGHAGAFASLGEDSSQVKYRALENAGVTMVDHPSKFGPTMRKMMDASGRGHLLSTPQKRGYHTTRRIRPTQNGLKQQTRSLHFGDGKSKNLLKERGVAVQDAAEDPQDQRFLAITVDRTNRCPAIIASPTADPKSIYPRSKTFPYDYKAGPNSSTVSDVMAHLQLPSGSSSQTSAANKLLTTLVTMFKEKEAYALETHLSTTEEGSLAVTYASFGFDDSAYKSGKRQEDLQELRDKSLEDPDEVSVEKDGIVYIKLHDPDAQVGTLINGAGLAMNADDALRARGARPTNFLDTGGKATKETVKQSFEVILKDPRVKVIFVNIFGGLTLCDMIAEGITLAFKDLDMKIPVVVRLRGTNEEKGQKMISESGLPLHAFDDFDEAAEKCKELVAEAQG